MTIPTNKVEDFKRRIGIVCNCATVPPTMPTCRDYHLPDCPIAVSEANQRALAEMRAIMADPKRLAAFAASEARASFIADNGQEAWDELREAFGEEAA